MEERILDGSLVLSYRKGDSNEVFSTGWGGGEGSGVDGWRRERENGDLEREGESVLASCGGEEREWETRWRLGWS